MNIPCMCAWLRRYMTSSIAHHDISISPIARWEWENDLWPSWHILWRIYEFKRIIPHNSFVSMLRFISMLRNSCSVPLNQFPIISIWAVDEIIFHIYSITPIHHAWFYVPADHQIESAELSRTQRWVQRISSIPCTIFLLLHRQFPVDFFLLVGLSFKPRIQLVLICLVIRKSDTAWVEVVLLRIWDIGGEAWLLDWHVGIISHINI